MQLQYGKQIPIKGCGYIFTLFTPIIDNDIHSKTSYLCIIIFTMTCFRYHYDQIAFKRYHEHNRSISCYEFLSYFRIVHRFHEKIVVALYTIVL